MKLTIRVWRQPSSDRAGFFEEHVLEGADAKMSVLELLDALNERLSEQGLAPVAFDSDCREGVCGACGLLVDGRPNGNGDNLPACHQRIGTRREGGTLTIEPFRSAVMPVVKDLVVDRCALDFLQGEAGASAAATGRAPMPTPCRLPAMPRRGRSTSAHASAAARAWPPAPMDRRPCTRAPVSPPSPSPPFLRSSAGSGRGPWRGPLRSSARAPGTASAPWRVRRRSRSRSPASWRVSAGGLSSRVRTADRS